MLLLYRRTHHCQTLLIVSYMPHYGQGYLFVLKSFTLIYVNWPTYFSCFQSSEKDALLYRKVFQRLLHAITMFKGMFYLQMLLRQNGTQDKTTWMLNKSAPCF